MNEKINRLFIVTLGFLSIMVCSAPTHAASTPTGENQNNSASNDQVFPYLESLKDRTKNYLAPSQIDNRFNIAVYVNTKGSGPNAQRMWVLQRDPDSGDFKLAMWDKAWWNSKRAKKKYRINKGQTPPFSWLVSTGKKWRGDNRSGPTSLGVFALDERPGRTQRGWHSRGMIHAMYIDLHYNSGRRSGIAFHGTTPGQYRKLGRIASHGCIRMHQTNALNLLKRIKGWDNVLDHQQRWGEVPRFWQREKKNRRYGYVRDGSLLPQSSPERVAAAGTNAAAISSAGPAFTDAQLAVPVLTKTGFRAISIIFKD